MAHRKNPSCGVAELEEHLPEVGEARRTAVIFRLRDRDEVGGTFIRALEVFDGRHKLVRYFGFENYNTPETVADLLENNHVGLYDLQNDPDEMNNLAKPDNPDYDEGLVAEMNAKLNALVEAEIGEDHPLIGPSQAK